MRWIHFTPRTELREIYCKINLKMGIENRFQYWLMIDGSCEDCLSSHLNNSGWNDTSHSHPQPELGPCWRMDWERFLYPETLFSDPECGIGTFTETSRNIEISDLWKFVKQGWGPDKGSEPKWLVIVFLAPRWTETEDWRTNICQYILNLIPQIFHWRL